MSFGFSLRLDVEQPSYFGLLHRQKPLK